MFAESFLAKRYQDGYKKGLKESRKSLLNDLVQLQLITEEQRKKFEELQADCKAL